MLNLTKTAAGLAALFALSTLFGAAVLGFAGLPLWLSPVAGPAFAALLCTLADSK